MGKEKKENWPKCMACGADLKRIDELWWECPFCGLRYIIHKVKEDEG